MPAPANILDGMPVLILGAGRGRRMGGPKALMPVAARPWWMHQSERLMSYGLVPHWVVSQTVHQAMQETPAPPPHLTIADEAAPMFASILAGLASIGDLTKGLFLLPVDTPAPRVIHWRSIARATTPAHPTYQGKGGHPLYLPCRWVERELGPLARTGAPDGTRLDHLIRNSRQRCATDDPGVTINLNKPQDLTEWIGRENHFFPPNQCRHS